MTALRQALARRGVRRALTVLAVLALCCAGAVGLVYYWRVFYSYGLFPFAYVPVPVLTAALAALAVFGACLVWAAHRFLHRFEQKAAVAILCSALLFVFVNPPLQSPDEGTQFLRTYAISLGRLDCDANRSYPDDVNALFTAFGAAWTHSHDGSTIKARVPDGVDPGLAGAEQTVAGECISNSYLDYYAMLRGDADTIIAYAESSGLRTQTEPVHFLVLPHLLQGIGVALVRLLGASALGCLYAARAVNAMIYTLLCYFALKNCNRYAPVFTAAMLLPLCLFMAGSCNYDGILLGIYFFAASYYCKNEITGRDVWLFALAFGVMTWIKPNNLLWLALPLVLPRPAWKTRFKKWHAAVLSLASYFVFNQLYSLYARFFVHNYGEIGRMIEGVSQSGQLRFMLANPVRTIAVFLGTLYENNFFLDGLGKFGNVDLVIPVVSAASAAALLLGAALSVHERSSLTRRSAAGLFCLAVVYAGVVMAGLYITYTPVAMARVIGLQTRYFIPTYLMLCVLAAALLSGVLSPRFERSGGDTLARSVALGVSCTLAAVSAVLLFQHYFVGPVTILGYN